MFAQPSFTGSAFFVRTLLATITAALLLGARRPAVAQYVFYPNTTTINTALPNGDTAVVGYANDSNWISQINGTSPTVNVVAGAVLSGGLFATNSSVVYMSGGTVGYITADNTSTVNITGGLFGNVDSTDTGSTVTVSGGSSNGSLYATNGGTVSVYSGTIGAVSGSATGGTMNIYGGTFVAGQIDVGLDGEIAQGPSTLNVYGNPGYYKEVLTDINGRLGFRVVWVPAHTVSAKVVATELH